MKPSKTRYIISFSIILILAVVTGLYAGNYYNRNFGRNIMAVTVSEETVRGSDLNKALKKAKGKTPAQLTATENFIVAENYLNKKTSVRKEITGTITAAGINQTLVSEKIIADNHVYAYKISASKIVKVAELDKYEMGTDAVDIYKGKVVNSTTADWPQKPSQTVTVKEYEEMYGTKPERMIAFVVGSKTVIDESAMKTNEKGNFVATLTLDTTYSVMHYVHEVKTTAGSSKLPYFKSVVLTYEIDKDWNLISYETKENYEVSVPVLGFTSCTGNVKNIFHYENVVIPE